jgi:site-specific recombinase XerD
MLQSLRVVVAIVAPGASVAAFPWHKLNYQHMTAVRSRLAAKYSPSTANKILAAVRGVLRAAFALGQVNAEVLTRATSMKSVRGERAVKCRAVTQEELRAMFATCDTRTAAGARDAALLAIAYGGGLRRHEVVSLDLENYDRRSGVLIVQGKGAKQRKAFVTNGSRSALETWLAIRGEANGPLFQPVNKADHIEHRRLTDQAVYTIVRRLASRARVDRFSPHDLRRSFIGDLLDLGADIATVQALAAHANVTTTARYDRRPERVRRRAAELLHVPFGH